MGHSLEPPRRVTSTHNLCIEQKCEKYRIFLSEIFQFLEVKFSIYLNRRVFVSCSSVILTMTNPNQLCDVLLFVCSKMAVETNLSSKLPVADRTIEV